MPPAASSSSLSGMSLPRPFVAAVALDIAGFLLLLGVEDDLDALAFPAADELPEVKSVTNVSQSTLACQLLGEGLADLIRIGQQDKDELVTQQW